MGSEGNTNSSGDVLIDMYSRVKLKASDGRVCGSGRDNSAVRNVKLMNVQGKKIMANNDVNSRGISNKKECIDFAVKRKALVLGGNNTFPSRVTKKARLTNLAKQEAVISSRDIKGNRERRDGQANINDEGTALKIFDPLKQGRMTYLGYRHEVGDMVWGRVESHPWWPGQIFDEAFACPSVCNTKKKGHVLVAFYGDNSYGWFEPGELIPFDPHFTEKSKQINTQGFLTAVGEAKNEVNKRAALGLTCFCRNPNNFRTTPVQGFLEVDVSGYENGCVYPVKQIERARDGFQPIKSLSFLQKLALMSQSGMQRNVGWMKNVARLLAYRRAVFEEFDETYAQAFGVQPVRPGGSLLVLKDSQEVRPQAPLSVQRVIKKTIAPLRVQQVIKKTIGTRSPRTPPSIVAFKNVRDHSSSSSKPPKKMPSSREKPIKKPIALNEMKPSTGEKKATNPIPLKVQGDEKMVGPTEPTVVVMKFPHQSPLPSVSQMRAKFARFGNMRVNYSLPASKVLSSKPVEEESPGAVPKLSSGLKKSTNDENGSIDSIIKAVNAINKKYCQVEARKNESNQSTSSTTNGVDISRPMLILLRKCSYIVDLVNSYA
ncbi:PWWP domain-containing protein 1-like isoform X1 [Rhododendron vialii]|uniref:PWWP domain-containing protein 1-like isoform X1 n=1 Tax=Rhododendron vialii TaxID=182163 RepID=UPI00265E74C1|nr:PWWP domain-containing protein 1-like isoform X1 [Rhododendron vialii]XP_058209258.1 PWWP domain-containing protein 1-like isoform X1 [Rhododendron vialii]XP_058209259.1 PWWP domain-containing protein 1-like isoform X1 [Rhododendron vialii]XP_058209260.1 PWWP domain-containing protein 1-like isoform X1 [Rhododendron vialii]XP_058209262.1 PWWP domain-containing protein 1-like isoform X1 [Rhododendron vialii]